MFCAKCMSGWMSNQTTYEARTTESGKMPEYSCGNDEAMFSLCLRMLCKVMTIFGTGFQFGSWPSLLFWCRKVTLFDLSNNENSAGTRCCSFDILDSQRHNGTCEEGAEG